MLSRDAHQSTDDIVDEMIGSGRWQLLITLLLSFSTLNHTLNTGTEALMRPDGWWCKKPNFLHHWTDVQWILYSHTGESCVGVCNRKQWDQQLLADGYFQGCEVYEIDYSALINLSYADRPTIDTTKTVACPYGIHYNTVGGQNLAEKFNRGCDNGKIVSRLWQSSSAFGRIIGYIFMGTLSDWIGRKTVIFISCGVAPITAAMVAISHHYVLFIISSIINGFFDGGFSVCLLLILEISTNLRRSELLVIVCCCFGLGIGILPTFRNFFKSYDLMLVSTNALFILMFPFIGMIPESPSWLFCTRRLSQLNKTVKKASAMNGSSIPPGVIVYQSNERLQLPRKRLQLWHIFLEPEIACEIIGIGYLTALFALIFGSSYYSILAHVTKSQVANALLAAATMGGMLCGQFCMLLMGHKKILQIAIALVLVSSFMLIIDLHQLKPSNTGPTTILWLVNVSVVSLSYGVLLNYNARTVPTLLRGTLSGIWKSIWALFVWTGNYDYVKFPTMAISLIMTCILAALFSLNLKDLYHRELPDTIEDSVNLKIKSKPKRWLVEENPELVDDEERFAGNSVNFFQRFRKNSVQPKIES
ncbi:solute carrier family 22 member 15-like [Fopius arisanus]|uniref:Solute carrier family 22 member 15-like n=1 Tax=Fopius arisanus TaxID=64838 RepID=A0A9R1T6Z7_9HYME|nr:PREDICTED: solute carrier family 22 member 15-like [Fopius arisanus]